MEEKNSWAIKIFNKSPLKKRKFNVLKNLLPEISGKMCLDIGSDNGVISYYLRALGGTWYSADLIPKTVELIKSVVKENVFKVDDKNKFPFNDNFFDVVLIVDFLEHVNNDKFVIDEIYRVLKQDGTLIINVPNPVNGLVRFFKLKAGQTDQAHGHVRKGYNLSEIKDLTEDKFEIITYKKYGRGFSDFIDFLIIFSLRLLKGDKGGEKGTVVGGDDIKKLSKSFKFYSLLYPFIKIFVLLDSFFFFLPTNMLTVKLKKK